MLRACISFAWLNPARGDRPRLAVASSSPFGTAATMSCSCDASEMNWVRCARSDTNGSGLRPLVSTWK